MIHRYEDLKVLLLFIQILPPIMIIFLLWCELQKKHIYLSIELKITYYF